MAQARDRLSTGSTHRPRQSLISYSVTDHCHFRVERVELSTAYSQGRLGRRDRHYLISRLRLTYVMLY